MNNWYVKFNKLAQSAGVIQEFRDTISVYIDSFVEKGKLDFSLMRQLIDPAIENVAHALSGPIADFIKENNISNGQEFTSEWNEGESRSISVSDLIVNITRRRYWFPDGHAHRSFDVVFMPSNNHDSYYIDISIDGSAHWGGRYHGRYSGGLDQVAENMIRKYAEKIFQETMVSAISQSESHTMKDYEKFLNYWVIPHINPIVYPPHPNEPGKKLRPHGQQTHLWHVVHKEFLPARLWKLIEKYGLNRDSHFTYRSRRTKAPYRYDPRKPTSDFIRFPSMQNNWIIGNYSDSDKTRLTKLMYEAMELNSKNE